MMYSSFAKGFFSLFSCASFAGESSQRLRNALDMPCFEEVHLTWLLLLGLPFGVIVVAGLPLAAFIAINANRTNIRSGVVVEK